jgi:hypothetical protein
MIFFRLETEFSNLEMIFFRLETEFSNLEMIFFRLETEFSNLEKIFFRLETEISNLEMIFFRHVMDFYSGTVFSLSRAGLSASVAGLCLSGVSLGVSGTSLAVSVEEVYQKHIVRGRIFGGGDFRVSPFIATFAGTKKFITITLKIKKYGKN